VIPLDVPVELGREEARRRVLEELDKAKYGGMPQWLEALLDRLFEWLRRIVEFVLEAGAGPRAVGGGINFGFLIILLVILAGIALVVWKVGLPRWRGRRPRGAEVELAADERLRVAGEHAVGDLQRLFELLEPSGERREGQTQRPGFVVVPGGADSQPRPAAREDVERGRRLDEEARRPIRDCSDERPELDSAGVRRGPGQGAVGLEHRLVGWAEHLDLEEVIHEPQAVDTSLLGGRHVA